MQVSSEGPFIEVNELRKDFGHLKALNGVSFSLNEGEFLTVFGPNGAGKTTLIKILSGLTRATSGSANVAGFDILSGAAEMKRQIGVISHASCLYPDLTAFENLLFYAKLYGLKNPEVKANQTLNEFKLNLRRNDRVRNFSRGMQQKLAIARATLHDPKILFLDEPFTGLDLKATNTFKEYLHNIRKSKRTIIMTTHDISCGLEICDKVAIQNKGKFIFLKPVDNIERKNFEKTYVKVLESEI